MTSDLDSRYDLALREVIGPGRPLEAAGEGDGRAFIPGLPATLPAYFDHFCAQHAAAEAIVAGAERLSYGDLARISDRLARVLAGMGIGKGDRVAIAMRNVPAWIVVYMAVVKAGGIAVLINGWWQADELGHALRLTEPKLMIADAERARRAGDAGFAGRLFALEADKPIDAALAPLLEAGAEGVLPEVTADDGATILFTSGSTGAAKGAASTHRQVTTGIYTFLAFLATLNKVLTDEGRPPLHKPACLIALPMFHVTGEVPVLLLSFAIARKMVLMPKWDPAEALRLIERERITYLVGVPTMSIELALHPDRARHDLSSLSDIASGGAARPVAHVAKLLEAFPEGHPMMGYGLTETNAVGCVNFRANYLAKPASTGRPHRPFVDVAILGAGDTHLPPGERGEIGIRSVANIKGYWRDEAATAAAFTADGYMRTGDVGYLDEAGYLFIVDRVKDIILRGGENVSAQEVEQAIYLYPDVAEASVFGLPDERLGEVPAAVVHFRGSAPAETVELTLFLEARLAHFKRPVRLWISETPLPKLGTGKIDKRTLRALYRERS